MRFECTSKYYPKPFEPNDLIRPHVIDVVVGTENGVETTAARLAVDFLDLRHAEHAGYSILHVCDADSAGWTHVFEAIIEPAIDFAELRQDFGFDDPVNGLLFLYRSVFHPTLRDWQRFIIDGVCAMFPSDTAMIIARNELELSEKDLASLGFRIVAGSDLLFRPNMLANEYSSVADGRDPSAVTCPLESGARIDEQWGALD